MLRPIIFRPRFNGALLQSDDVRLAPLQASWLQALPQAAVRTDLDFEDWVETAVRLDVALKCATDRVAILQENGRAYFLNGEEVAAGSEALFLGAWNNQDDEAGGRGVFAAYPCPVAQRGETHLAQQYASSAVFQAHAGRALHLCGIREFSEDPVDLDLYDCLAQRYQTGHRKAFVKVNLPKYALFRIDIPSGDPRRIQDYIAREHDDFALSTLHLAGRNNQFLVQEQVPMACEYRVVVVNHKPVAGAGCVEAFTPLDNEATWDPKVERLRNSGHVERCPEVVEAYARYALEFAKAYQQERPGAANYTLDLALGPRGILVIELNPLKNYGLYAMDFEAILRAQLRS